MATEQDEPGAMESAPAMSIAELQSRLLIWAASTLALVGDLDRVCDPHRSQEIAAIAAGCRRLAERIAMDE